MKAFLIILIIAFIIIVVLALNLAMRLKGYSIPGETVARCSKGHLFRTIWIEGGSLKAIRLGPRTRYQYCPIGKHWSIIHPVKEKDLTGENLKTLAE